MKTTELRIGNWVKTWDGKEEQIQHGWEIDEGNETFPIPLTEEWLERFGIMQNTWFEDGSYMIKEDRGFGWEMYVRNAVKTKRISFAYFKHVHQLQNLYFALTGEELTQNK
jgi:hypothetical protein